MTFPSLQILFLARLQPELTCPNSRSLKPSLPPIVLNLTEAASGPQHILASWTAEWATWPLFPGEDNGAQPCSVPWDIGRMALVLWYAHMIWNDSRASGDGWQLEPRGYCSRRVREVREALGHTADFAFLRPGNRGSLLYPPLCLITLSLL